jgi:DNA-binding GntR family transcriptional regulator
LTTRTIVTRLADHLSQRIAADGAVSLGMSQGALAEELGTAREVVVRALAALVAANALRRVGRSRFVVVDRSVLRSIAGG